MQHKFLQHTDCNIPNCSICGGKVKICLNCGGTHIEGGESSLTTHCINEQLSADMKKKVASGEMDFIGGRWINKKLGPTIAKKLVELDKQIVLGSIIVGHKNEQYICVGMYNNSKKETVYCFHEVVNNKKKYEAEFISLIHWTKLKEIMKEIAA